MYTTTSSNGLILKCTEVKARVILHGMIFIGFYHEVGFEFNVYVDAQGCLNRKTRQNPVWRKLPGCNRRGYSTGKKCGWIEDVTGHKVVFLFRQSFQQNWTRGNGIEALICT